MPQLITILTICLLSQTSAWGYDRDLWASFPSMNYVTGLAQSNEAIYVATTGGIRRYDRFAQKWLSPLTKRDGLPDNRVQSIIFDPNARELWFDTPSGPGRWLEGLQTIFLGGGPPQQSLQSRTRTRMPPIVPPFGYYVENNRIIGPRQDFAITQTLIDNWNNLWIATWGLGVGMANLNDQQLHFDQFGPIEENVTALAIDGNTIWVGGEDTYRAPARGISRYDRNTQKWEYFEAAHLIGLENPQIRTILTDSTTVWFGTHKGLMRYNKQLNRWLTYRDTKQWGRVNALAKDRHILWIGSERGLALLDTRADSLDRVSGSEQAIINAMATGSSHIWAGTETGLYKCARGSRTWRVMSDEQNFSKRSIRALAMHDSTLWIATENPSTLLCHHIDSNTWQEYPLAEIAGSQGVSIAVNDKHVWISSDQGAFLFEKSRHLWTRYHTTEGLIHERVQAILLDQDDIWFGTGEGLSRFHGTGAFLE
jgi:ligand-binding sensor domain-containing protein